MMITGLRSPRDTVLGLVYAGRMFDKIRLHATDDLPTDYSRGTGFDNTLCRMLELDYDIIVQRVLKGGEDIDILEWCFEEGYRPKEGELDLWNDYLTKRGWRDETTARLGQEKCRLGFENRADLQTWFDLHDADEERI